MTLSDIQALIVRVDPEAGHYESAYAGGAAYTVWRELHTLPILGDNTHTVEAWAFQIDRFTKAETDAVAAAFRAALDGEPGVAFEYQVDFEPDTGYIHHIFDCEGI